MTRCHIMYPDEASNLLSDWLSSRGYDFVQSKLSSDCAEYDVSVNNTTIKVWFDAAKQLFGFDRLHGGVKTGSFEVISEQFDNYIEINSVLIPEAKLVADMYERALGIKTVFDTFVGKAETGYTVKFRNISDKAKGIRVKQAKNGDSVYQAMYVEYTGDSSYSILHEHLFELDRESGKVTELVTEGDFHLQDLACEDAQWYDEDELLIYDKDSLYLEFEENENGVVLAKGNNGLLYTVGIALTSKTLAELIDEVVNLECWEYIPLYDEVKDNLTDSGELVIEDKAYKLRSKGTSLFIKDNNRWVEIMDSFALEGFIGSHSSAEGVEEVAKEIVTKGVSMKTEEPRKQKQANASNEGVQVKKLMKEGKLTFVRFIVDGDIYDIKPEAVEQYGLSCDRIKDETDVFLRFGMEMTEDELELKKFATNVKDDVKIKEVIASLFR